MNIRTTTLPALLLGALLASSSAQAATAEASLAVKLVIAGNCTTAVTNIDFGTAVNLTTAIPATGAVNVNCTLSTPYSIALDLGAGSGATFAARRMTRQGGTATVNYSLRHTSTTGPIWGNGTNSSSLFNGTGTGNNDPKTVFASVPVQAHPGDGTYNDTVKVTVTW